MAKMNMKDALEQALRATKAYIDNNHYNQTEVDALLDTKSDEGHTHDYLPLSGGTIESAEFAPLKIKSAGGSAGNRLVLDITNEDLNKKGGFWSELSYVPDLKLDTEYTLVIGDNSYTSTCQLGQDLQSREILFFNQNIYIRTNWDGNAGVYKEGVTFVRHYDTTEFKLYEAGAEEIASAIAFENNDGVLGHIGMVNDSGSELLRLTPDGQASYRVVDEGNFTDIITYSNIGAAPAYHGEHFSLGEGSNNAYYGDKGKIAYDHSQSAHAPSNAQKNSDITKAEIEAKLTGNITSHTHNYAGSSSAGGAATSANKVNSNLVIKINGGTNEGTNMFTFNGSAGKTIDLTPAALGLSAAGHTHDDRYYTETEIDTKLGEVQDNIQDAIDGFDGAIAGAKTELQTAINNEATSRANADNALDARLDVLEGSGAGSVAKALADAKSYADTKVAAVLDSAPDTLNTLNELAAALGDDPNFATTIATQIGGKADKNHGNHVPAVETANNAKFLRNDNTWATVTPANIGAADASHGTHVSYDDTNKPKAAGTAACGTSGKVARADHVHPVQTSVSGNAGSANKVNNALSIQLNGGTATSFDGSAAKSINITPASIGAAAAHNHDAYVNKNAFANIKVGETTVAADAVQDTVELVAGTNVTITPDATNDKITITAKDTTYSTATTSANGLMSSGDKSKLNGIASGAEVNQNAFANVVVGETTIAAEAKQDTLTIVAGSNVTITPDATNDKITIAAKDTVYTHPNSGATAGSYGPSENATPAYGATFNVPYITVNAAGHVTAISTKTVKIPASDKVTVTNNLTSTSTSAALSANQGKVLKDLVDTKADMVKETELTAMLAEVFGTTEA